jgi:DNA-binding transcriptional MerR regulator
MTDENENLRKRLYVQAKRKGLRLQLSRKTSRDHPDYQTYRILDRASNEVIHAARPGAYGLTLEQVEEYLDQPKTLEKAPTKLSKAASGDSAAKEQATSDLPRVDENTSMTLIPSEDDVIIADTAIPAHIVAIFNLILIWATEAANARPAGARARKEPDSQHDEEIYQFLQPYFDAYTAVRNCSARQRGIYMFARLLGLGKEA